MRIVFMGTAEFAVASLKALHGQGLNLAAVVTQSDKKAGRGQALTPSPVKQAAVEELIKQALKSLM